MAQMVKNLPETLETQMQCPGWEEPLEKGMATHSSILAWWIPRTEEPGELHSMGSQSQTLLSNFMPHARSYSVLSQCFPVYDSFLFHKLLKSQDIWNSLFYFFVIFNSSILSCSYRSFKLVLPSGVTVNKFSTSSTRWPFIYLNKLASFLPKGFSL